MGNWKKIFMGKICVLIAAAGKGTRSGLTYPKTLFPIEGKPILVRIIELLAPYDAEPSVIVSEEGKIQVSRCLLKNNLQARLVVQSQPRGMGDAVLCIENAPDFTDSEHILLVWGDIPFIQSQTVADMVEYHMEQDSDFTFATRLVDEAYTLVLRDKLGDIIRVIETREEVDTNPGPGERDIGLFIFRRSVTLQALREDSPDKWGQTTGQHGFLYVIRHLVSEGFRVSGLPIAREVELVSLNSLKDVSPYL